MPWKGPYFRHFHVLQQLNGLEAIPGDSVGYYEFAKPNYVFNYLHDN